MEIGGGLKSAAHSRFDPPDSIAKQAQTRTLALLRLSATPRPRRMLQKIDKAFGVRHQPQDQARRIGDPRDVVDAAVGICPLVVGKGDKLLIPQRAADGFVAGDEFSFAVRYRELERLLFAQPFRPDA